MSDTCAVLLLYNEMAKVLTLLKINLKKINPIIMFISVKSNKKCNDLHTNIDWQTNMPRTDNPAKNNILCHTLLLIMLIILKKFGENLTKTVEIIFSDHKLGLTDKSAKGR